MLREKGFNPEINKTPDDGKLTKMFHELMEAVRTGRIRDPEVKDQILDAYNKVVDEGHSSELLERLYDKYIDQKSTLETQDITEQHVNLLAYLTPDIMYNQLIEVLAHHQDRNQDKISQAEKAYKLAVIGHPEHLAHLYHLIIEKGK
jgi:uncharacterized protein YeeX (DUF496 family)